LCIIVRPVAEEERKREKTRGNEATPHTTHTTQPNPTTTTQPNPITTQHNTTQQSGDEEERGERT